MSATMLYKYLDANGGMMMLRNSNLQFTNATRLNDPFDCHPALIDFSNVPNERCHGWSPEVISKVESNNYVRNWNEAWICSLSKVHDSLLMWSYYGNHKGVCIGIDREKTKKYLSNIPCVLYIGAFEMEVTYRDIIEKPDYYREAKDYFTFQLSTKAKAWEHEQEVRLLLLDPFYDFANMALPFEPKDEKESIDYKELRAYPKIGGECFDSLYLGIKIDEEIRNEMVKIAKERNPNIKIYQMMVDPEAFRLKEELIRL